MKLIVWMDAWQLQCCGAEFVFTRVSHAGSWVADPGDREFAGYLAELRT